MPKSIEHFDSLSASVSPWLHADQTLHSPRTVLRDPWRSLPRLTSSRRSVSCGICAAHWILD